MQLRELMDKQAEFDRAHRSRFEWAEPVTPDRLDILQFVTLSLAGEVGELANAVKKIVRGDLALADAHATLEDEITDTFMYLMKFCNQLGIDLEHAFFRKMAINENRFSEYEKQDVPPMPLDRRTAEQVWAKLDAAKYRDTEELEAVLWSITQQLPNADHICLRLRRSDTIAAELADQSPESIIFAVLLSFILSYAADHPDRHTRAEIMSNVAAIAEDNGLPYNTVSELCKHQTSLRHTITEVLQ